MSELYEHRPNDLAREYFDHVIIGGGPVGLWCAAELAKATGSDARILVLTSRDNFGGLADRSLEQYRQLQASPALSWMVDRTIRSCVELGEEIEQPMTTSFPYVFLIGKEQIESRHTIADYRRMVFDTTSWGYDAQAEELTREELRARYPFLDGDEITAAMAIRNAGRIHFDAVKDELMRRSQDKVRFAAGVHAGRILNRIGQVTGVETDLGRTHTDHVVLAPGAQVLGLPMLVPGNADVQKFQAKFTVTQRELFYSKLHGLPVAPGYCTGYIISPDNAYVRFETDAAGNGTGTYGYAGPNDPRISLPRDDPEPWPDEARPAPLPAVVYDLLSGSSSRFDGRKNPRPTGRTAGYYTEFEDHKPVVGPIPGLQGATIAAGASHHGVMSAAGFGAMVREAYEKSGTVPICLMNEVSPYRKPGHSVNLML